MKRQETRRYPVCPVYIVGKNVCWLRRKLIYPPAPCRQESSPRENRYRQQVRCYRDRRVPAPFLLEVSDELQSTTYYGFIARGSI